MGYLSFFKLIIFSVALLVLIYSDFNNSQFVNELNWIEYVDSIEPSHVQTKIVHGGFADGLYRISDDVHSCNSTGQHTATINLADFLCRSC